MAFPRLFFVFFQDKRKKRHIDNQNERLRLDMEIANSKPEFVRIIKYIQKLMIDQVVNSSERVKFSRDLIELGAGVFPMSKWNTSIISTDIVESSHLDGLLDATRLELPEESLDGLFLQNTFHHIPDPDAFFKEAVRVLRPGGRLVIVDPYHNLFSRGIYKKLFSSMFMFIIGKYRNTNQAVLYYQSLSEGHM